MNSFQKIPSFSYYFKKRIFLSLIQRKTSVKNELMHSDIINWTLMKSKPAYFGLSFIFFLMIDCQTTKAQEILTSCVDTVETYQLIGKNRYYYEDEMGEFFGLKDGDNHILTPAIYYSMTFFKDNVAIVTNQKGKYGAIDLNSIEIMPLKYDYLSYDSKLNQYIFSENGKYGLIVNGSIVIQPRYDMLTFMIDELATFTINEKLGLINLKGQIVVPAKFENIEENTNELFTVVENGHISLYDIKTLKQLASNYDYMNIQTNDQLILAMKDRKYGYLNKLGMVVIPCKYTYASVFTEGTANVALDEDLNDLHQIDINGLRY